MQTRAIEDILSLIETHRLDLTTYYFGLLRATTSGTPQWAVTITAKENGAEIKAERRGVSLHAALNEAWAIIARFKHLEA